MPLICEFITLLSGINWNVKVFFNDSYCIKSLTISVKTWLDLEENSLVLLETSQSWRNWRSGLNKSERRKCYLR